MLVHDLFPGAQLDIFSPLSDFDILPDGKELRGVESAIPGYANVLFELVNFGIRPPVLCDKFFKLLFQPRFFVEVPLLHIEGILGSFPLGGSSLVLQLRLGFFQAARQLWR